MFSYLASPYTYLPTEEESKLAPHLLSLICSRIEEFRFDQAMSAVCWLLDHKITVYSPIVHFHPVACTHNLPRDIQFWRDHNLNMLAESQELIVLTLEGWDKSSGVGWEREQASLLWKPTLFLLQVEAGFTFGKQPELP